MANADGRLSSASDCTDPNMSDPEVDGDGDAVLFPVDEVRPKGGGGEIQTRGARVQTDCTLFRGVGVNPPFPVRLLAILGRRPDAQHFDQRDLGQRHRRRFGALLHGLGSPG